MLGDLLQGQFEQAVFRPIGQEQLMTNLEVMLAPGRLAHLRHHIELAPALGYEYALSENLSVLINRSLRRSTALEFCEARLR